jgi:hypothetical protein
MFQRRVRNKRIGSAKIGKHTEQQQESGKQRTIAVRRRLFAPEEESAT